MTGPLLKRTQIGLLTAAAGSVAVLSGCLERTISVTTEPPGALVWINDVEVGRTPLESDFTFYGVFDVRIRREGYEPILTTVKANAPVQEWPGIDLVAEALPVRFNNVVRWHWVLTPVAEVAQDKTTHEAGVVQRANELRSMIPPTPPTPPPQPTEPEPAAPDTSAGAPTSESPPEPARP